jgi:hypothetical protein
MKLLTEIRTLLEAFAFTLLDKEVLEREDTDGLMSRCRASPSGGRFLREGGAEVRLAASERVEDSG